MPNTYAFADEYGTNSFDYETQGTHFVVGSVIIKEENLNHIKNQVELIRKKYFQAGEIKSKKVGGDAKRRLLILQDLLALDFTIYAVAVDKRKLVSEGFRYKKSFYKFCCGLVYQELFKTFPELDITVDEHGSHEFMRSFKLYVEKNHTRSLFEGSELTFTSSTNNVLVQLADFITGTLGRYYDESKNDEHKTQYMSLLSARLASINEFPTEYKTQNFLIEQGQSFSEYDREIATVSINLAIDFIDKNKGEGKDDIDRINFLRLLLMYQRALGPGRYITTVALLNHLNAQRSTPMSNQYFRTKIVGKLRDSGVLIASSSSSIGGKSGYKLPASLQDVKNYIQHGNNQILPILSRIKICRERILLATHNQLDVLNFDEYLKLKNLLEK